MKDLVDGVNAYKLMGAYDSLFVKRDVEIICNTSIDLDIRYNLVRKETDAGPTAVVQVIISDAKGE